VAQGSEAGGHGGRRGTLPFVPVDADLAAPTPVLAAGGIADGRGLGAALVLGAAGALIGTRFQATMEALVPRAAKADYRTAADRGDLSVIPVWAGKAIDVITDLTPAADVVTRIAGEAEEALLHVGANLE
jgi:nitronate monooxygenase